MKFTRRKKASSMMGRYALVFVASVVASCLFFTSTRERFMESSPLLALDQAVSLAKDSVSQQANTRCLHNSLTRIDSDKLWAVLVNHAGDILSNTSEGVAMEVGMHNARQCLQAAKAGLQAHCFEPSPKSFGRVKYQVEEEEQSQEIQSRVHIYNQAASNTSEGTIDFKSSGGTGDHVGEFDMWKMKKTTDENDIKVGTIVQVPQVKLDDVVRKIESDVHVLKVDTQGFEPIVFSGLSESLQQHKIKFILLEYWPRGMDLHADKQDACVAADLASNLVDAGYTLYALTVLAHPKAPQGYKKVVDDRPLDDLEANCQWYLDLEKRFPSDEYKMGYWSDILAVAPDVSLDQEQLVSNLKDWVKSI